MRIPAYPRAPRGPLPGHAPVERGTSAAPKMERCRGSRPGPGSNAEPRDEVGPSSPHADIVERLLDHQRRLREERTRRPRARRSRDLTVGRGTRWFRAKRDPIGDHGSAGPRRRPRRVRGPTRIPAARPAPAPPGPADDHVRSPDPPAIGAVTRSGESMFRGELRHAVWRCRGGRRRRSTTSRPRLGRLAGIDATVSPSRQVSPADVGRGRGGKRRKVTQIPHAGAIRTPTIRSRRSTRSPLSNA